MIHQRIIRGAAVRDPAPANGYAVRLRRHADLTSAEHRCWADLSAEAGAANVFAEHWFMDAALRRSASARDVRLAIVSDGEGAWLGVLPLAPEPRFGRWPTANWQTWSATNQFLGTPLVRPDAAHEFWKALLRHFDRHAGREMLIHCRQFALDDPVCTALIDICRDGGRGFRMLDSFDRPARLPHCETMPDGKARARQRSLQRRLEREQGPISIELQAAGADCRGWIDRFLALEKSGWKGQAGSALACDPETEGLFRDVIEEGHDRGRARLATLTAGGRPLAMSSWFVGGNRGFGFKMAYDEAFRAYAPGMLLMRYVADRIGEHRAMLFDTCATVAGGCSQPLWGGSRTIVDCAVAIGPSFRRLLFDALMQARAAYTTIMPGMSGTSSLAEPNRR